MLAGLDALSKQNRLFVRQQIPIPLVLKLELTNPRARVELS
jgi:hypothetical protein